MPISLAPPRPVVAVLRAAPAIGLPGRTGVVGRRLMGAVALVGAYRKPRVIGRGSAGSQQFSQIKDGGSAPAVVPGYPILWFAPAGTSDPNDRLLYLIE